MPQHILVATDGSNLADKAVVYALDLAKELHAKITAVTVSESLSASEIANKFQAGHVRAVDEFEKHAADAAGEILTHAKDIAQEKGIAIQTVHIKDSHPAEGIILAADTRGCDLIVMASHGRRGLSKLILGSQAQEVLGYTKRPVLICK